MLISLPVERYSRCYPRYEEQYSDVGGEPLYMLMPSMQASQSQMFQTVAHSNLWTAIAESESVKVNWEMTVATTDAVTLQERIRFPETFNAGFKVSPKQRSLGFRYLKNQEFQCRLCYDSMYRFGILNPIWTTPFQFDNGMEWASSEPKQLEAQEHRVPENEPTVPIAPIVLSDTDSNETTLSSQDESIDYAAALTGITEPALLSADLPNERQIQCIQERSRRVILRVDPSKAERLRDSVQRYSSQKSDNPNDFSFLLAASIRIPNAIHSSRTGASSGIGEACAFEMAALGCNLVYDLIMTNSVVDSVCKTVQIHQVDIRDKEAIRAALKECSDIDILVNNAGLALGIESFVNTDEAALEVVVDTNIKGLMYVTREVLPKMLASESVCTVINIGSIAGKQAYPNGSIYCATKHAVHALSQSLRMELISTKVRVAEINPGTNRSCILMTARTCGN
ncbi:Serine 3-dehydrogenase [Paramicrosporidium saccamoebae]|uniref:Serine 3-dehydrogenase n=1 Tax=Paramicrosporidium saccamoebae TaxID=1246581 RepID=A0A2H9TKD4_9FUNG|nr:Serine 3-dehydrogenase [Paramicrosporidium saccamoebae]